MDPSQVNSQANSLSYLIPTGEGDIAVREILIPIFGDAIACKVPGMACGTQTIHDPGALTAVVFSTFNAATLIFCTILLTFIGILMFVKTAQDGEFMGKSWNTTFTALRMVAGIAFLLPMPNSYSTIQNFVLYTGLWSSGVANLSNVAISDHYLKRLQVNMLAQDAGATSLRTEAQQLLGMHMCASAINTKPLANLRMESNVIGKSGDGNIEFAYVERGHYFTPKFAPCGRFVVKPYEKLTMKSSIPTDGVWNAGFGAEPLTSTARKKMVDAADSIALKSREARLSVAAELRSESGPLRMLADELVQKYVASQIKYDAKTSRVASAGKTSPEGTVMTEEESLDFINRFASILRAADTKLNSELDAIRSGVMNATTGEGVFLAEARKLLQEGGWMSAAATYRTMLDMVSFQFSGTQQNPFRFEEFDIGRLKAVSGRFGVFDELVAIRQLTDRTLGSDTGTQMIAKAMGTSGKSVIAPNPINTATLEKIPSKKLSLSEMMDTLYGGTSLNGFRDSVVKSMAINPKENADPLFQMKNIGDTALGTAEALQGTQFAIRTLIGFVEGLKGMLPFGIGADAVGGWVNAGKYILDQIFGVMQALTIALLGIGYAFSTWLPALPFLSFLLAQLGWIFGLVMTLFAVNIWAVMHTTPARSDSFIGSDAQGYLMITSVFFRPILSLSGLSLSYIIAPPAVKLVNLTLLPMMVASNVSSNTLSVITATIFGLILYFVVVKAVLSMVFMLPQSFPDEVMKVISASTGDLGQSRALSTMEASEGSSRVGNETLNGINKNSSDQFKATLAKHKAKAEKEKEAAANANTQDSGKQIGGMGEGPGANSGIRPDRE